MGANPQASAHPPDALPLSYGETKDELVHLVNTWFVCDIYPAHC